MLIFDDETSEYIIKNPTLFAYCIEIQNYSSFLLPSSTFLSPVIYYFCQVV